MPKLVTKVKYYKPGRDSSLGTYAKYIATREGVDKIDASSKDLPASAAQRKLIERMVRDYPDTKEMPEYLDYTVKATMGNASDLITRVVEDTAHDTQFRTTYADYIATRPRAQRFGEHGLFTDNGVPVNLEKVSEELNAHEGNVWTLIVSLRREDAERLGYNTGERWRDMLRMKSGMFSEYFHIPRENLRWYAAFHNESHHPHVHIMVYSTEQQKRKAHLTKAGLEKIREALAVSIFKQDRISSYERQTKARDDTRKTMTDMAAELVTQINNGTITNPLLEEKMVQLAAHLQNISGKKVYGYLPAQVKDMVDAIVDLMAEEPRIKELYDLWYREREEILRTYTDTLPKRLPMSEQKEFKPVRNAVVRAALDINTASIPAPELPEPEPEEDSAVGLDTPKPSEASMDKWRLYRSGKEYLRKDSPIYDPVIGARNIASAAGKGVAPAKYLLAKLYFEGKGLPKNHDLGIQWLQEACTDHFSPAEYLYGKLLVDAAQPEEGDYRSVVSHGEGLLKEAAGHGNTSATFYLARAYLQRKIPNRKPAEAIRLLRDAADKGHLPSTMYLARMLTEGKACAKDLLGALKLLDSAAEKGDANAKYMAARLRIKEKKVRDVSRGIKDLQDAAAAGHPYAMYLLGMQHLYGQGVPKDKDLGMKYLKDAADHGNAYAAQAISSAMRNQPMPVTLSCLDLFRCLAGILEEEVRKNDAANRPWTDRKLLRKIREKEAAHGIRL